MALAAVRSKAVVLLLLAFCFIFIPIVGARNCSMLCCTLLYVHSSFAIILMGKRELVAGLVCLPCVSRWFVGSSLRYHGFVCGL